MKILIVEDDYLFAEEMRQDILAAPEFNDAEVEVVGTEQEFRDRFEQIQQAGYDLIILDVMIRWVDPSPEARKPDADVLEDGYFRAGIRCLQMLRQAQATKETPVVIHSNMDEKDILAAIAMRHVHEVSKIVPKWNADPLMKAVRQAIKSA